jgi:hypothetical protein
MIVRARGSARLLSGHLDVVAVFPEESFTVLRAPDDRGGFG